MNNLRQFIIGLGVAALAIFFTFKNIPINEISNSFQKVEYIFLFPAALIILISYIVRVYRWHVLVAHIKPIPVGQLFPPMMIGLLGNLLPMRAGEIFRAYLLKKKTNIPFTLSLSTIMIERMFDILMLNIFFIWILIFHSDLFGIDANRLGFAPKDIAYNFGLISGTTLFLMFTLIYFIAHQTNKLSMLIEKIGTPFPGKWADKCKNLLESF